MKTNNDAHVEKRLKRLEAELEQLRSEVQRCQQFGWRAIVGSQQGSQTFDEIVEAIQKQRQKDYAQARGSRPKRSSARKTTTAEE